MLVYVLLTLTAFAQPSLDTLKTFEDTLVAQIDQSVEAGTGYRPLLANFLRLAFHDCVGTCDGCINMDNPHHLGLQLSLDVLGPMVDQWKADTQLSRADLFAFAGFTAAKYAMGPGEVLDFDYAYGRVDCEVTLGELAGADFDYTTQDSAANEVEILPDSHDSPYEFMTERFGFTDTMTTAIMGVHVVGRMSLENSGHSGLWVNTPCELDGEFYREMINVPWDQEASVSQTFGTRQQWGRNGGNNNKFLNSDMALIVDFEHTEGVVNDADCRNDHRDCPEASTLAVAESFRDDATFVAAFKNAFLSMISNGFSLTTVCEEVECDMAFRSITTVDAQFCGNNVNNGKGKGPGPDKGNGPPPPQGGQQGGKGADKGRGRRLLRN